MQTEMKSANKKLDDLAAGFEKLREDVIKAVAISVTQDKLDAEITKLREDVDKSIEKVRRRHMGETLLAILATTVITYLVTYFLEHR